MGLLLQHPKTEKTETMKLTESLFSKNTDYISVLLSLTASRNGGGYPYVSESLFSSLLTPQTIEQENQENLVTNNFVSPTSPTSSTSSTSSTSTAIAIGGITITSPDHPYWGTMQWYKALNPCQRNCYERIMKYACTDPNNTGADGFGGCEYYKNQGLGDAAQKVYECCRYERGCRWKDDTRGTPLPPSEIYRTAVEPCKSNYKRESDTALQRYNECIGRCKQKVNECMLMECRGNNRVRIDLADTGIPDVSNLVSGNKPSKEINYDRPVNCVDVLIGSSHNCRTAALETWLAEGKKIKSKLASDKAQCRTNRDICIETAEQDNSENCDSICNACFARAEAEAEANTKTNDTSYERKTGQTIGGTLIPGGSCSCCDDALKAYLDCRKSQGLKKLNVTNTPIVYPY